MQRGQSGFVLALVALGALLALWLLDPLLLSWGGSQGPRLARDVLIAIGATLVLVMFLGRPTPAPTPTPTLSPYAELPTLPTPHGLDLYDAPTPIPNRPPIDEGGTALHRVVGRSRRGGVVGPRIPNPPPLDPISGIHQDKVLRERIEHEMRVGEATFRAISETSPLGIFLTDRTGNCIYTNQSYQELSGLPESQSIGNGWTKAIHPEDRERVFAAWVQAAREQKPFRGIQRLLRPDGSIVWTNAHAAEIRDESLFLGHVGIIEDISERIALQRAMQEAKAQTDAMNRELLAINQTHRQLFGSRSARTVAEVLTAAMVDHLGARTAALWLLGPGDRCGTCPMARRCRDKSLCLHLVARAGEDEGEAEPPWRVPLGTLTVGRVASEGKPSVSNDLGSDKVGADHAAMLALGCRAFCAVPLIGNGQVRGVVALYSSDWIAPHTVETLGLIADLAVSAFQNVESLVAKEAANQAKSQFLANMSHEIRTPMTAVMGYADMLLNPAIAPGDAREAVRAIKRSGEHLLQIINDILDLSKIEAEKLEVERVPSSPGRLVADVISTLSVRAAEKRLVLRAIPRTPLPRSILTDPIRLRQILFNLVGNAIKFTHQGEIRVAVALGPHPEPGRALLSFAVEDDGVGMSPEQIGRLFQAFNQADASTTRAFGGTGLGLMISRRLAAKLDGEIAVTSEPGIGSVFTLRLPIPAVPDSELVAPEGFLKVLVDESESEPEGDSQVRLQFSGRVLVADDNRDNQRILDYYLRKRGLRVALADNGRDAIQAALTLRHDLVLLDIQMPELDGYAVLRALRDAGYERPIVALTAHALMSERERCIAVGFDDYLRKPIEIAEMDRVLESHLGAIVAESPSVEVAAALAEEAASSAEVLAPSRFDGDPDFRSLIDLFLISHRDKIARMRDALDSGDRTTLRTLAHQTQGAAGMYGFAAIGDAARTVEEAVDQPGEPLRPLVERLARLSERVLRYYQVPTA